MTLYEVCLENLEGNPMRRRVWDEKGYDFYITGFPLKKITKKTNESIRYHALYEDIIANDWYIVK